MRWNGDGVHPGPMVLRLSSPSLNWVLVVPFFGPGASAGDDTASYCVDLRLMTRHDPNSEGVDSSGHHLPCVTPAKDFSGKHGREAQVYVAFRP